MRYKKLKVKPRGPMCDNSRNISVRMTEEQYQRLQRYRSLIHIRSTIYFRHLIHGNRLKGRSNELHRAMHASLNKIYSNIQQMARHQRAAELDADAVAKMRFLMDKLCEEIYLLASQK